jgi:hypothetical protein
MRLMALHGVHGAVGAGVRGQGQPLGQTLDMAIKVRILVPELF